MEDQNAKPKPEEIERIVREVLARIGAEPEKNEPGAELTLSEPVVTLSVLTGRLEGVERLRVSARAVLTPAVRDLLRARSIAVVRQGTAKSSSAASRSIVLGLAETGFDPTTLVKSVGSEGVAWEHLARSGLASVVEELADETCKGGKLGVLITDAADLALCLANRQRGVRAVLGRDVQAVRRAVETFGANLLVLETLGRGPWELMRIVRQFAAPAGRTCPAIWEKHLR